MGSILGMLFANPLTTYPGLLLVVSNLGHVLVTLGSGKSVWEIIQDPHTQALVAGVAAVGAKDFYITGGSKSQD